MGARQAGTSSFIENFIEWNLFLLGAIYLKNHINTYWSDRIDANSTTDPDILALAEAVNVNIPKMNGESSQKPSLISDADKDYLRNILIDAIIRTKDPLR
jgi:hypothetical protein